MLKDMLNLTGVQVARKTISSNGMGGTTTTTVLTTLTRAALWMNGSGSKLAGFISDKIMRNSTHVLVTHPSYYSWAQDDKEVIYDGNTYRVVGWPDDVMGKGEILVVGLEMLK